MQKKITEVEALSKGTGQENVLVVAGNSLKQIPWRSISRPDASADYAASGAASVEAWATMAKAGYATQYRTAAGRYVIETDGAIDDVTIWDIPNDTARVVQVVSCSSDPFVYVSICTVHAPGGTITMEAYFSSEEFLLQIGGKSLSLPYYEAPYDNGKLLSIKNGYPRWETVEVLPEVGAADNGKFLRVVSGAWAAQALTNVAEVGA